MSRYALCIGINKYPSGLVEDLQFCMDDAKLWGLVLGNLGFDVSYAYNEAVTVNGVASALAEMLDAAQPGDVVVMTYSGHGTQVIDTSGDESDGWDEALFVHDGPLVDDVLRVVIDEHAKPGVAIAVVLDCCFSGTATRSVRTPMPRDKRTRRVRFVPNAKVGALIPKRRRYLEGDMVEVLWSACADDEYSYEDEIDGVVGHGVFTYYATKAVSGYLPGLTYEQLNAKVGGDLPSTDYPQTPQLEGKNKGQLAFEPVEQDGGGSDGDDGDDEQPSPSPPPPDDGTPGGIGCIPTLIAAAGAAAFIIWVLVH